MGNRLSRNRENGEEDIKRQENVLGVFQKGCLPMVEVWMLVDGREAVLWTQDCGDPLGQPTGPSIRSAFERLAGAGGENCTQE